MSYPGEIAIPTQVLLLADEYRSAALLLIGACRRGEPLSHAPFRFAALQAVELYLNAFLLHRGHAPAALGSMQHDLAPRMHRSGGRRPGRSHLQGMDR